MRYQRFALRSSAIAVAMSLLFASPAVAQDVCDAAGAPLGTAIGTGSLACGQDALSDGENSTALGTGAFAGGYAATAVGAYSTARGDYTLAIGLGSDATSPESTAVGHNANAVAAHATSFGYMAWAMQTDSTALGAYSRADGANSVAIGANSIASEADTVSIGSAGNERRITNVAAAVNPTDAVNLAQMEAADAALSMRIDALEGNQTTQSHDPELEGRLDEVEALTQNMANNLKRLDDKIDSSTAIAIALSGNMLLPDNKITVTGNIGTYRGAFAGALQAAAYVSPKAALNFGVASNFNKRKGVGARAGFSMGW